MQTPAITYDGQFLAADKARLFAAFQTLPWQRHVINMYGKQIPAPRFFVWMGQPPPKLYGHPVPTTPWTPEATEVRDRVFTATGVMFDSLNINMYRDNNDYLGWHVDPADEGRWEYPIASVTLGAERAFQMRPYTTTPPSKKKVASGEIHGILLEHGSLLIMPPQFQASWLHRAPKQSSKCGMRINLTFRRMAP